MPRFRPLFAACLLFVSAHASAATPRETVGQVADTLEREYFDPQRATAIAGMMLVASFALLLAINLLQAWTRRRHGG